MTNYIQQITERARGQWQPILSANGIEVPTNSKKHAPCPACGGKDRFRFDDKGGRGTWICGQCDPRAGDGLALIMNVKGCTAMEAAKLVADSLGVASTMPDNTSQNNTNKPTGDIESTVRNLLTKATPNTHPYLINKGYDNVRVKVLPDGKAIIPLVTLKGEITGAQTITPEREKRLLAGTKKVGKFALASKLIEQPSSVIIAEGSSP